jgi:hypothetical protein
VIDRIMAVVEGQPILLSDVQFAIQFALIPTPAGTTDAVGLVLNRLIERMLMLAEVERFQPPEPDPVEVTIRLDELRARAGSDAAFDKALAVTGASRDQLRRYIRDDLRIGTYLNQRFGVSPTVTPTERAAAIATWVTELRRRADISIQYRM